MSVADEHDPARATLLRRLAEDPLAPIAGRWCLLYSFALGAWLLSPFDFVGGEPGGGRDAHVFMDPRSFTSLLLRPRLQDMGMNVMCFVPVGLFTTSFLAARGVRKLQLWGLVLVVGAGGSTLVEGIQHWSRTRVSSWLDVACNGAGVLLGIVLHRWWCAYIQRRALP